MSGSQFELESVKIKLDKVRMEMREYFLTKGEKGDELKLSHYWYNMFDSNINKAIRSQSLTFSFGAGGGPTWFAEAFRLFSKVLALELEHGRLVSKQFNPPEFGVNEQLEE